MSLGLLTGTVMAMLAVMAAVLVGLTYLFARRGKSAPPLPFYAGGVALLLVTAALVGRSEFVSHSPHFVRSGLDVAAWLGASFFLFTILDALIIGEWLIERGQRYIPDIVRQLLIGTEVVAAGVLILWLVMGINLVALVALPTVAAAMVGVALKDTLTRFFSGIELGKIVKVGDWITVADREGIVTHIGMEHVTLLTRAHDLVSLPNDLVIQSGVTNFNRPTTTHFCSVYVDAAYRKLGIGEIEKSGTLDGMVEKLAKLPLEFSPGASWNYSVSTDILGYIVGKLSGMKFEDFLHQRIFKPLGMVDTDFHVPDAKHARLAANYAPKPGGGMFLYDDPGKSSYLKPPSLISGGGGLVSTMADYYRFASMLLAGGTLDGVQYLSPKTIELMTQNHIPGGRSLGEASVSMFAEQANLGSGFGLGFSVNISPALSMVPGSVGEYAWGGAASTYFFVDPKEKLIVIFLTQLIPSSTYPAMRRDLRTLVYSAMTRMHG
ncbi:MAG TPA: serine hydrolase [Micropepsaceae bacterium]|nr:serine hydrolase [Micropepsaceae bacterium]